MQIHELTRRRTNEGFGTALATQAITKALGGTNPLDQKGPAQSRDTGFASMVNSPAAKTLATTMQAAWTQTVKNFLANAKDSMGNPATSVKNVTQPSTDALRNELRALVNKMIGGRSAGFDYANMANNIGDEVAKAGIQEVIARINEYSEAIFNATVQGIDPKVMANNWTKLVGDGILPAQNAAAYDRSTAKKQRPPWQDPQGRWIIDIGNGPEYLDKNKPEHKEALEKLYSGQA